MGTEKPDPEYDYFKDQQLLDKLLYILSDHCGEAGTSEGAEEVLKRLVAELKMLREEKEQQLL